MVVCTGKPTLAEESAWIWRLLPLLVPVVWIEMKQQQNKLIEVPVPPQSPRKNQTKEKKQKKKRNKQANRAHVTLTSSPRSLV